MCVGVPLWRSLERVQRVGAQAIIGTFRTVAVAVSEAEASIRKVREWHADRAAKLWVCLHTLPGTNPLSRLRTAVCQRFTSPLQKIAQAHEDVPVNSVENTREYVVNPWEERIPAIIDPDSEKAVEVANRTEGIYIATSSSERKGMVGMGGAIYDTHSRRTRPVRGRARGDTMVIQRLPPYLVGREITVFTSNQAAIQVVTQPKHQSGQDNVTQIYGAARKLEGHNRVLLRWIPAQEGFQLGRDAKKAAQRGTELGKQPEKQVRGAKSTIINWARAKRRKSKTLPEGVGNHLKKIATALPGRHTRILYDALGREKAGVLAQLRTGMARLNGYLHQIGVIESDQCACGRARETVGHFLFNYSLWEMHRDDLSEQQRLEEAVSPIVWEGKHHPIR
jgi:hypothetical protein